MRECPCGSGRSRRDLLDARGIFCTFVCDLCEKEKRSRFNVEIFDDPQYETCEPVEEE